MWPMVIGAGLVVGILAWLSGSSEASPKRAEGATPPPPGPPKRRNEGAPPVRAPQGAPLPRTPQGGPPSGGPLGTQGAPPVSGAPGGMGAPPSGATQGAPPRVDQGGPPSSGEVEVPFGGVRQATAPVLPGMKEIPTAGPRPLPGPRYPLTGLDPEGRRNQQNPRQRCNI